MPYFLPEPLLRQSIRFFGALAEGDYSPAIAENDGIKIPGYVLNLAESQIAPLLGEDSETCNGTVEGVNHSIISSLGMAFFVSELEKGAIADSIESAVSEIFSDYSALTGYSFTIRVCSSARYTSPPPKPYQIEIVIGASPPGSLADVERKSICGIPIDRHNYYVRTETIATGRGILVKDSEGTAVAQIIDSTFYFFIPRLDKLNWMFKDSGIGTLLFKRIFKLAWNAFVLQQSGFQESPLDTSEQFVAFVQSSHDRFTQIYRERLSHNDIAITVALEKYRELLRDRQMMLEVINLFEGKGAGHRNNSIESIETWQRLRANPLIHRLYVIERGIQIETTAIMCEHDRGAENIGSVVIRYPPFGSFTVWGLKPTHPKGIAHPHINPRGNACFGNVMTAIETAASEGNIAEGFERVLRWLTQGYDPQLAETKIEEWMHTGVSNE